MPGTKNTVATDQSSSSPARILGSIINRSASAVAIAPLVNPLACMSAVGVRHNIGPSNSCRMIYGGQGHSPRRSFLNFYKGLTPHTIREISRSVYKGPCDIILRPELEKLIPDPTLSAVAWAVTMTAMDTAFHPFDTWRVLQQAPGPLGDKKPSGLNHLKQLYAGAVPSALKHGPQSFLYAYLNGLFNAYLENNGINPHSTTSTAIQAPLLAIILNVILYPTERIKNEKQFLADSRPSYLGVVKNIVNQQGYSGFFRGVTPKFVSSWLQLSVILHFYNQTKHAMKAASEAHDCSNNNRIKP